MNGHSSELGTETPDQEQPERHGQSEDVSTQRGLPKRIVVGGVVAAIAAGGVGAIIGYVVSGPGLALGLGLAFALILGVLSGYVPTQSEDGAIAKSVSDQAGGDEP